MSSLLPARRIARPARAGAIKENENANARLSRLGTRTKPPSNGSGAIAATGGVARTTAASRAKAAAADPKADLHAGKRKREAFGEVAVAGNKPAGASLKGKDKEVFDGVVIKKGGLTVRPPLRTATGTTVVKQEVSTHVKVESHVTAIPDDNAMMVDHPTLPSLTTRRSNLAAEPAPLASRKHEGYGHHRVSSSRSYSSRVKLEDEEDEGPVHKKRRTSSVPPEEDPAVLERARLQAEQEAHLARLEAEMEAFSNEPEVDPETSAWDDLDAEDADDPLMVSEYVQEIFNYLKQVELTTMPNPNYMENQKELAWNMRGILTDWLIQVHVRFRLLPETLFLAVNIVDRFLSSRVVSLVKLQLVGVACLFIAAKFEEVVAPSVSHFLMCADSSYTESEILVAEKYVLKTLDWNLSYPNPVNYLRRISKADEYNVKVRTLAKYLLEVGVLEWRLIAAPPSLLAAAAIWLARLALGHEVWTPNLAHYSSYKETALIPTANLMVNYILKPIRHAAFYKKYAGKKFFKSSVFMREWALDRWDEGTQVSLARELPRIKAEVKLERELHEDNLLDQDECKDLAAQYASIQDLRSRTLQL